MSSGILRGQCGQSDHHEEKTVVGPMAVIPPKLFSSGTLNRPVTPSSASEQEEGVYLHWCGSGRTNESFLHYYPIKTLAVTAKIFASKNSCLLVQQMSPNMGISVPIRMMETNACLWATRAPAPHRRPPQWSSCPKFPGGCQGHLVLWP